jgi:hypothetical protein
MRVILHSMYPSLIYIVLRRLLCFSFAPFTYRKCPCELAARVVESQIHAPDRRFKLGLLCLNLSIKLQACKSNLISSRCDYPRTDDYSADRW